MDKFPCQSKVLSFAESVALSQRLREEGKKLVVTTGVYDLIHIGHLFYLQECATYGDILIVGVAGDEIVRQSKGPNRPITTQEERALIVAGIEGVSYVFISNDLLKEMCALKPHIWVISSTSNPDHNADKKKWARDHFIEVVEKDQYCDVHTTDVIAKIRSLPDE